MLGLITKVTKGCPARVEKRLENLNTPAIHVWSVEKEKNARFPDSLYIKKKKLDFNFLLMKPAETPAVSQREKNKRERKKGSRENRRKACRETIKLTRLQKSCRSQRAKSLTTSCSVGAETSRQQQLTQQKNPYKLSSNLFSNGRRL